MRCELYRYYQGGGFASYGFKQCTTDLGDQSHGICHVDCNL